MIGGSGAPFFVFRLCVYAFPPPAEGRRGASDTRIAQSKAHFRASDTRTAQSEAHFGISDTQMAQSEAHFGISDTRTAQSEAYFGRLFSRLVV
ncbi:hypothetical protein BHU11_10595 [Tannerella sp. oral taxon 808]|nr:hypothetical protein BHU11_10595 [Tannerella sp. oral taxon 808]